MMPNLQTRPATCLSHASALVYSGVVPSTLQPSPERSLYFISALKPSQIRDAAKIIGTPASVSRYQTGFQSP
jgi:hypothetical protein